MADTVDLYPMSENGRLIYAPCPLGLEAGAPSAPVVAGSWLAAVAGRVGFSAWLGPATGGMPPQRRSLCELRLRSRIGKDGEERFAALDKARRVVAFENLVQEEAAADRREAVHDCLLPGALAWPGLQDYRRRGSRPVLGQSVEQIDCETELDAARVEFGNELDDVEHPHIGDHRDCRTIESLGRSFCEDGLRFFFRDAQRELIL